MLDTKIITKETAQKASETNAFDVMVKLLESRYYYGQRYAESTSEEARKDWNALIVGIDEHLYDLKAIATDQYDQEEDS